MKTTKELKKEICSALNVKPSQVSVRADGCATYAKVDCIDCIPSISLARSIMSQVERIDRCPATGDILSGGNHYTHANYRKVDDNAKTLLWAILDLAIARSPSNMDYRNGRYFITQSCVEVAKENPELDVGHLTAEDFGALLDFGNYEAGSALATIFR